MYRRHRGGSSSHLPQPQHRRHRQQKPQPADDKKGRDNDDDEEEEDFFTAMSSRRPNKKPKTITGGGGGEPTTTTESSMQPEKDESQMQQQQQNPETQGSSASSLTAASTTSSMKRHHKEISQGRKAKMDALLQELQFEQQQEDNITHHRNYKTSSLSSSSRMSSSSSSAPSYPYSSSRPPPPGGGTRKAGGSHVEPGEEHLTTNIFVGNLAPNLTEEELTQLFGQFGELYSVKIMWPRTAEERARQRLTGFVCFYHRQDAEEAMEACNEADPFRNGRRLMLRWGKSVLKGDFKPPQPPLSYSSATSRPPPAAPQPKPHDRHNANYTVDSLSKRTDEPSKTAETKVSSSSLSLHKTQSRIKVIVPSDPRRAHAISLVASFVAKDGADLEQRLLQDSRNDLTFLTPHAENMQEHIFYKWRVYAFAQGDTEYVWQTEPFVMVRQGCVWIPPPVDREAAARQEEEERRQKKEQQRNRQRRPLMKRVDTKNRQQTQRPLSREELNEFHSLTRVQLCASREAIAQAMSFCFEKCSHSAPEIADLLKELLLLRTENGVVEPRIARLYLLSDVLFNSQQPGVRNAFYYRDAIQQMAPQVFASLGDAANHGGRLTHNKLTKAVSNVLAAWTNWSVYNPTFLDELYARFEGKEITTATTAQGDSENDALTEALQAAKDAETKEAEDIATQVASTVPRGDWKEVEDDEDDHENDMSMLQGEEEEEEEEPTTTAAPSGRERVEDETTQCKGTYGQELRADGGSVVDGQPLVQDSNGPEIDDVDGEPLRQALNMADTDAKPKDNTVPGSEISLQVKTTGEDVIDGVAVDSQVGDSEDGEPLEEDDLDGEPLEPEDDAEDDDADGQHL